MRRLRERAASAQEAALDAGELWERAGPASPDHPYAARKRLVLSGLRQLGDQLLVPMFDAEGSVRNLQRIKPAGTKRFLKGGQTDGLFFVFGRFTRAGETACLGDLKRWDDLGIITDADPRRVTQVGNPTDPRNPANPFSKGDDP